MPRGGVARQPEVEHNMGGQMRSHFKGSTLRILASGLLGLALVSGAASTSIFAQHGSTKSAASSRQMVHGGSSSKVAASGTVDMSKAKPVAASFAPRVNLNVDRSLKTPAQLAAYRQWVAAHPGSLPHATSAAGAKGPTTTQAAAVGKNMYGGGATPVVLQDVAGLNSSQAGGWFPPDQAIGTVGGLTIEGVNDAWAGYASNLTIKYGPFTAEQLFAPVMIGGDHFSDPQITWQTSRGRWLVSWLEVGPTKDWIDIGVSLGTVPSPVTAWHVYRVDPEVPAAGDFCDYDTMGYDYWGMYVTCVTFANSNGAFLGNNTFAFSISHMESGSLGLWDFWYSVVTDVSCGASCVEPAYRLSPATEDGGYPQAEYVAATDAGWSVVSANLTLCAITNTIAVGSVTLPTFTCAYTSLPVFYSDPVGAAQFGSASLVYPGFGFKQFALRAGRLAFAMPVSGTCNGVPHDFIAWESVDPQLTALTVNNPQFINGIVGAYSNGGYHCYSGEDEYLPTYMTSTEGEATLTYDYSNATFEFPGIGWTGSAATDAPGTIGQCNGVDCTGSAIVVGTNPNGSGRYGDYSACALDYGYFARGTLLCGGEFGGPHASGGGAGWDTQLFQIRMI
jgi:hypothetical protein